MSAIFFLYKDKIYEFAGLIYIMVKTFDAQENQKILIIIITIKKIWHENCTIISNFHNQVSWLKKFSTSSRWKKTTS